MTRSRVAITAIRESSPRDVVQHVGNILTKPRRKSRQNASVSASPQSRPITSPRPDSGTPWASTQHLRTTPPPSQTFSTFASRHRYG